MKPVVVPFFISHQGCPHTCVFCDQRTISGSGGSLPDAVQICATVEQWRQTAGDRPLEVAFFGGTFTALPLEVQENLLGPLQPLLADGVVDSVRISTRPDVLDDNHVSWLAERGVRVIELGVQSLDDAVLAASGRGHVAADSLRAIGTVRKGGITVGVQLMPGLPGDTPLKSFDSLNQVIAAGADFLRIYPTVVLRDTELAVRYAAGTFLPLTLERGVSLCKILLQRAMQAGVPVIRIGLQAGQGLDEEHIMAGCWHPALGQMVRSQLYDDLISRFVADGAQVSVACHPSRFSDVVGVKRCNLEKQAERGVWIQVVADVRLGRDELEVRCENNVSKYSIVDGLNYCIHEV